MCSALDAYIFYFAYYVLLVLSLQVDHVILYDFPREPSEYIRRVGRTGRAGRAGKVTVLVYGKQLPAARAVMKTSSDGRKIQPSDSL